MEPNLIARRTEVIHHTEVEAKMYQYGGNGISLVIELTTSVPHTIIYLSFSWPYVEDLPKAHAFMNEFVERLG